MSHASSSGCTSECLAAIRLCRLQVCLLEQRYLLDDSLTVAQLLAAQGKELTGQPLAVAAQLRVQVGEGLEAADAPDFAAEVSAMAGKQ
jgi:translation elongation factor EF-Ts